MIGFSFQGVYSLKPFSVRLNSLLILFVGFGVLCMYTWCQTFLTKCSGSFSLFQEMKTTHYVTIDNVVCAYFDQVENLVGFGSNNRESIAQLVWAFFNYWAYHHDYANDVISVRTGSILRWDRHYLVDCLFWKAKNRKRTQFWTRCSLLAANALKTGLVGLGMIVTWYA